MTWLDETVLRWVVAHRLPLTDHAARAVMLLGTDRLGLAAVALLGLAWVVARHRYRFGAAVVLAVVASALLAEVLKEAVGRARPPWSAALVHAGGLSLPSTDAALTSAGATALYLGLTWLAPARRRAIGAALVTAVLTVGVCLVYLGVHWTSDVAAGWAVGAAVGAGTVSLAAGTGPDRRRSGRALRRPDA